MKLNKNQKNVTILMTMLLIPVLLATAGNYEYLMTQPVFAHGVNAETDTDESQMASLGLYTLLLLMFTIWLFVLCFIIYILRSEKTNAVS
jgi:heme/copper-type cytochrome/quinol oxidase subunit 2